MSRIAYIISAYKDAPHLARLVAALDDRADFYVHIDLNADIHPFEEALGDKVTFVPRHRISWGGWEQVEYQKELLAAVLHSGIPYTRVVCLSGQDYPLWNNNAIHHYFEEHQDTEFIGGFNLTRCTVKQQLHKITHYHPFRDLPWKSIWWKNKLIVASRKLAPPAPGHSPLRSYHLTPPPARSAALPPSSPADGWDWEPHRVRPRQKGPAGLPPSFTPPKRLCIQLRISQQKNQNFFKKFLVYLFFTACPNFF